MWTPIQANSSMPIYEQIIGQVVAVIASGGLKPDDYLPSVREMAGLMLVNPNTVLRAYRHLETAGLIASVRGMGMVVLEDATERTPDILAEMLRFRFRPILADAQSYGISASDIIAVVESELEKMPSQKSAGKSKSKPNQNKTETDQEFSQ